MICGPPAPQTQKAPDALASGAYMPWWSCVNKNYTFYTINSKCYIFVKIGIPTKIPTLYFHAMEPMPPVPLLPLHPGLALASPSSVSPPPERSSFPAGVGLPGPQPVLRGRNEIALSVFLLGLALHAAQHPRGKGFPHMVEEGPLQHATRHPEVNERRIVQSNGRRVLARCLPVSAQCMARNGKSGIQHACG